MFICVYVTLVCVGMWVFAACVGFVAVFIYVGVYGCLCVYLGSYVGGVYMCVCVCVGF